MTTDPTPSARYHLASLWTILVRWLKAWLPFYTKHEVEHLIRQSEARTLEKVRASWEVFFYDLRWYWLDALKLDSDQKACLDYRMDFMKSGSQSDNTVFGTLRHD